MHIYYWIFVFFTEYPLHVSALNAPSSGRTLYNFSKKKRKVVPLQAVKVTFVSVRATRTYRRVEVQLHPFLTSVSGDEWSASRPDRFTPERKVPLCPLYRRLVRLKAETDALEKKSFNLPGIEPRFFGRTARSIVNIPTASSHLPSVSRCAGLQLPTLQPCGPA